MKTNRRNFLQHVGAGAAGLTLASPLVFSASAAPGTEACSKNSPPAVPVKRNKQMWPIKSGAEIKADKVRCAAEPDQLGIHEGAERA